MSDQQLEALLAEVPDYAKGNVRVLLEARRRMLGCQRPQLREPQQVKARVVWPAVEATPIWPNEVQLSPSGTPGVVRKVAE